MATIKLDPKKTALLLLDLQTGFLARLPEATQSSVVAAAASAIATARQHSVQIAYVRAALDASEIEAVPSRALIPLASPSLSPHFHPQPPHPLSTPSLGGPQTQKLTETDNTPFAPIKSSPQLRTTMHPSAPTTQIHPSLAPQSHDLTARKIRYGTFMRAPSNALLASFASLGIETVILGGVVTSGAVLSAVRQLHDLDFQVS